MDKETAEIGDWRRRIDELDRELIRLLNERARCAIEIGKIKRRRSIPIYDPKREEQIIRTVLEQNRGPLDATGVRRLFERIIDESRRIERVSAEAKRRKGRGGDADAEGGTGRSL
jgi:chorismate mutase